MANPQPQGTPDPIQRIASAITDDLAELAKIAGLDPIEAFVGADLRKFNLSGSDLSGFNLTGVILRGVDLRQANLQNTKLRDADLSGAKLRGADLKNANLSDANLSGADLRDAKICETDLRDANLSRADLRDADLRDADLSHADLSNVKVIETKFKSNSGLDTNKRRELKRQGAIVDNNLNEGKVTEEEGLKWWIRYVIVPVIVALLGSGGIIAVINFLNKQSSQPNPPSTSSPTNVPIPTNPVTPPSTP